MGCTINQLEKKVSSLKEDEGLKFELFGQEYMILPLQKYVDIMKLLHNNQQSRGKENGNQRR